MLICLKRSTTYFTSLRDRRQKNHLFYKFTAMSTDGHRILNSLSVSTPVQLLLSDHSICYN